MTLRLVFGHSEFRGRQKEIVEAAVLGEDNAQGIYLSFLTQSLL